jgi:arsenate reductase-like glutaredoxin family protein
MKAREFLARKLGDELELRNIIKEPLSVDELRRLASRVGGVDELVAPKRRAEAEGLHGEKLLRWLAADGARVRRPIVVTGAKVTLGFSEAAREELEAAL